MKYELEPQFVQRLMAVQNRLYAFLLSLLGHEQDAEDLLQQTNFILCSKAAEATQIEDFSAWACRIAFLETKNFRRKKARDRHTFDDDLLELLASEATSAVEKTDDLHTALTACIRRLSERQRELILRRYEEQQTVQKMAAEFGDTANALSLKLFRIRKALLNCIHRRLGQAAS